MDSPRVGIVVPIYNNEKYLMECMESLLKQDYENIHIICVNDCSTDASWDILQRNYAGREEVSGICLEQNCGASHARNVGIDLASQLKCEFVHFFDSDDIAFSNMVSNKIKFFEDEDVAVVYSDYTEGEKLSDAKYNFRPIFSRKELLKDGYITCISMARTKDLLKVKGFDINLRYAEDWDLWVRLLWSKIAIKVNEAHFWYRTNPESTTGSINREEYSIDIGILKSKIMYKLDKADIDTVTAAYDAKKQYIERANNE